MSILTQFKFEDQEIRFVDGKPVANDIAKALGYADASKTISTKVKEKNKSLTKMVTLDKKLRDVTVLEDAGIYQLIFSSKLESAEKFQDWVFEEVLPSIRKTGKYEIQPKPKTKLELAEEVLALAKANIELIKEQQRLELENKFLYEENEYLAEEVDELYGFSSIIRVALHNDVSEKNFSWHKLKAVSKSLNLEIKRVPCPRFETKNLYSHLAWKQAYANVKLPVPKSIQHLLPDAKDANLFAQNKITS